MQESQGQIRSFTIGIALADFQTEWLIISAESPNLQNIVDDYWLQNSSWNSFWQKRYMPLREASKSWEKLSETSENVFWNLWEKHFNPPTALRENISNNVMWIVWKKSFEIRKSIS